MGRKKKRGGKGADNMQENEATAQRIVSELESVIGTHPDVDIATLLNLIQMMEKLTLFQSSAYPFVNYKTSGNFGVEKQDNSACFASFNKWLEDEGLIAKGLDIRPVVHAGNGIVATNTIEKGDTLFKIPLDKIITMEEVESSDIFSEDLPVLRAMPIFAMAMYLLSIMKSGEAEKSKWVHYIRILPSSYSTPLYFTQKDVESLNGSPSQLDVKRNLVSSIRMYIHLRKFYKRRSHRLFKTLAWEEFRWAVSTVSTRQNLLDTTNPNSIVLIPYWDMCNHSNSLEYATFIEDGSLLCKSSVRYVAGEEIRLFYGDRTNTEFLVYNGFVPEDYIPNYKLTMNLSELRTADGQISDFRKDMKKYHRFLLQKFGFVGDSIDFNLPSQSHLLLRFVWILQLDEVGYRSYLKKKIDARKETRPENDENDSDFANEGTIAYLEMLLGDLLTFYEADVAVSGDHEDRLKTSECSSIAISIDLLRAAEKEGLTLALDKVIKLKE